MLTRCCYIKDHKRNFVFIPGCMGGAAVGPHGCTCLNTDETIRQMETKIEHLEAKIGMLIEVVKEVTEGKDPIAMAIDLRTKKAQARQFSDRVSRGLPP